MIGLSGKRNRNTTTHGLRNA